MNFTYEQNAVKQRLRLKKKKKHMPLASIGAESDSLKVTLSRQVNGDTAVSFSVIALFLDKFPDVSAEWLLRGEGDMFKHTNHATIQTQNGGIGNTQNMNTFTEPIDILRTEIAAKNDQLKAKDDQLRSKDEQIARLLDLLNK